MKRYIKSSSTSDSFNDNIATVVANIDDIMKDYYGSEVNKFYKGVEIQDFDNNTKQIEVLVDIPEDEFDNSGLLSRCDNAVQTLDPASYFWYNGSDRFIALIRDMNSINDTTKEDTIVNDKNIEDIAYQISKMFNSRGLGDWYPDECWVETISNSVSRVHIGLIDYSTDPNSKTSATSDVFTDDIISLDQFKYDLIDDIYTKLVNNITS